MPDVSDDVIIACHDHLAGTLKMVKCFHVCLAALLAAAAHGLVAAPRKFTVHSANTHRARAPRLHHLPVLKAEPEGKPVSSVEEAVAAAEALKAVDTQLVCGLSF